jgi:RNA polymerase sigma-70 factor (ECF subfamily)
LEQIEGLGRKLDEDKMHSSTVEAERERDILRRLRHGDRRGLEELMDRYGEDLMRYLAVILGNRESAEDVFQDTWVKVMERIGRYDLNRPFAPWLFRVARNCAYDQLRRKKRWWSCDIDENRHESEDRSSAYAKATADRSKPFDETLATNDLSTKLLAGLEPRQRELVWLRFYGELSYQDIAERCSVPLGTVKSGLRRALDRLASIYQELEMKENVEAV